MKLHEFIDAAGHAIRLNEDQMSEIRAHPQEDGVTEITMSNGNKVMVREVLHKVLARLKQDT
jgi:uncharacterized protein YlzI (FlbEa/FlbD family)